MKKKEWQRGEDIAKGITSLLRHKLDNLADDLAEEKIVTEKEKKDIKKGLLDIEKAVKKVITSGVKNALKIKKKIIKKKK